MPKIVKAECFTLDETLCEQQDSMPGQGILVGEDFRGGTPARMWDRRAEAMECCRERNPFSSLRICHPEGAGSEHIMGWQRQG